MLRRIDRLPTPAQLLPVYGVIVLMLYGWTILWFFWKLPSWLYFMNVEDILMALAYLWGTNFLESLVALCLPVILALVLPRRWFADAFVPRGASLAMAGTGYLMFLGYQYKDKSGYPALALQPWFMALLFVLVASIVYLAGRIAVIRNILMLVADRTTIFIYLLVPLSLISLVVILVRWFF